MPNFSNSIVKNRGVKIDNKKSSSTANYFLKVSPLSLMDTQTIYNSRIDGQLYFFNINELPAAKRIIPKHTLIITTKANKSESEKTEIKFAEIGNNLKKDYSGEFYSTVEGFLIYENNSYQIIPVIKDASFSLSISKDAMEVACNFFPPAEGHQNISYNDILREFKKLKITSDPDIKLINNYLKILATSAKPINNVIIAKGSKAEAGKDGWVEYLIETNKSSKPSLTENGRVDFYNLGTTHSAGENQKLAIVHPPIPGKAGIDVLGRISPPALVKKAENPQGTNTYFNSSSPNILRAKIGGYVTNNNGKLSISEEYNVRGNIDFHTGNIISSGAVNINGNVRSGFKLDLDKSITINGFVNDADIKSHGSVTINGGFGGSGEGKISAVGNVSLKHIRNQTIYSEADIIIAKEAVDAHLHAKGNIRSMNGQAIIVGGTTIAEKDVEINTLGNEFGVKTKIQVGSDYELIEKSYALSLEIKELKTKLKEKEFMIKKYSNIEYLTDATKQKMMNIISAYKKLKNTLTTLKNNRNVLQKILKSPSKSKVVVTGIAYPGVEIVIQNSVYTVTEKIRNKTFAISETEEGVIELK